MNQALTALLGIDIPIIQAPTASIAGPELAAAVSGAGGLGALGLTWTGGDAAVAHVRWIRERTDRPFMVNFALGFEPVALESILAERPSVVSLSWGDPEQYARSIHEAGALLAVQVGNRDGAVRAMQAGADVIICQGVEAGGHVQSTTARDPLLAAVLSAVRNDVPVVAAGGIADAEDIAAAIRLGASGVMMGTRFVATQESRAHSEYKRRLTHATSDSTALTVCFDGGWPHAPHRVLRNSTLDAWEAGGCMPPGCRPGEGETVAVSATGEPIKRYEDTSPRAGMSGQIEAMALYAGTGVGRLRDLPSAGELVMKLWVETRTILAATG